MSIVKSLFLDRDGVINELLPSDYVKTPDEFIFREKVLEELSILSSLFDYLFIVTNQQGVGKGIMREEDLNLIHKIMLTQIKKSGGRIDKIYYCVHLKEENCDCRKPKTGMLIQAFNEFPEIRKEHSILIGDSPGDIDMANAFGIKSVCMMHSHNINTIWNSKPDYSIQNLEDLRIKVLPLIKF